MGKNILFLIILAEAVSVLVFPLVAAQPPYVGGYLRVDPVGTNRVHLAITFTMTDPSRIPSGGFLAGI